MTLGSTSPTRAAPPNAAASPERRPVRAGADDERRTALAALHTEMAACRRCVAAGFLAEAHPIFRGRIGHRLMILGQAPGAAAHERPLPYSGATGRALGRWLERAGFPPGALHERFYLTSLTKCFPGPSRGGKGDRAPSASEIALCGTHLDRELALVRPEVVVTLGRLSAAALCPETRRLPLAEAVGTARTIDRTGHRFVVVPLPHPSGVSHWLNDPANRARLELGLAELGRLREDRGL